jgi:hypothetical protein
MRTFRLIDVTLILPDARSAATAVLVPTRVTTDRNVRVT